MTYDVSVVKEELQAVFDLKGPRKAVAGLLEKFCPSLPSRPNSLTKNGGMQLYHVGPDHWLLRAALQAEASMGMALGPANCPADASAVRVSDSLQFFAITGPDAADIMAIGCPLDLHPSAFGADDVTFTECFGIKALVRRLDEGFELAVDRSYADMVEDYLSRALA